MMKYFKFNCSTETSVIGEYPQCGLSLNANPRGAEGLWNVKWNEFPDFVPHVELVMNPRAKTTDILSAAGPSHGFILNKGVKSILEECNLPPNAFYLVKVHSGNSTKDYYWFHNITHNFWEWVDKDQSKLYLRSIFTDKHDDVLAKVNLFLDPQGLMLLARNKPQFTNYYWEKLVFNEGFPALDFLETPIPSMNTIISEKLLHKLEKSGITGYGTMDFCEVLIR